MKTIKEIRCALMAEVWQMDGNVLANPEVQDAILRGWVTIIINECNKAVSDMVHAEYTGLDKIKAML